MPLGCSKAASFLHKDVFPLFQAVGRNLEGEIVSELVHSQTGKPVAFAENHTAGIAEAELLAVSPGSGQFSAEEIPVDVLGLISCQDAQGDAEVPW